MTADRRLMTRIVLRNYKSIAACDVSPAQLCFLVGPNGSGKSNFWTPFVSWRTPSASRSTMPSVTAAG